MMLIFLKIKIFWVSFSNYETINYIKVINLTLSEVNLEQFSSNPFERVSPNADIYIENTKIISVGKSAYITFQLSMDIVKKLRKADAYRWSSVVKSRGFGFEGLKR
jgi:hypothetical protein